MKKIPYIDYKAIPEFCTINEVCRLFEVSKQELQELCETYDVQPRRNEIGEYGFVSYDVRSFTTWPITAAGRTGGRNGTSGTDGSSCAARQCATGCCGGWWWQACWPAEWATA